MKILYFTADFSAENIAFARANGLLMRNSAAYHSGDTVEMCDKVCGDVPEAYANFPYLDIEPSTQEIEPEQETEPAKPKKKKVSDDE